MTKRGLVLVVGGTGSGKSTSLAAMIDHRNRTSRRPHHHRRRPGRVRAPVAAVADHASRSRRRHAFWHHALKNTLRQAPDVILIGEIRDTETMEHAITFAETGHLCLGTLHANSANQTMDRIINFFPEERRKQLLMDLSANLRAIVSQRLVRTRTARAAWPRSRSCSTRRPLPSTSSRASSTRSRDHGQVARARHAHLRLGAVRAVQRGPISYDEAIRNADSANELRLNIKLKSQRGEPGAAPGGEWSRDRERAAAEPEQKHQEELNKQEERRNELEQEQMPSLSAQKTAPAARSEAPIILELTEL